VVNAETQVIESRTRDRVLRVVSQEGPVSIAALVARLGLTETALRKTGALSDTEVRTARMGNWERDLSQLLVPTTVGLGLTAPDRPIMQVLDLIAINDFGRGVDLHQFGTYDPVEHIDNPTGLRGSDVIDQGGVAGMPAHHADGANPDNAASISGPGATVHAAGSSHDAYADRDERYRTNSHTLEGGHHVANASDAAAFQVDETAIPNYIYASRDWCTQTLRNAARLGTQRDLRLADAVAETLHGRQIRAASTRCRTTTRTPTSARSRSTS
jgi:hypothetical protein